VTNTRIEPSAALALSVGPALDGRKLAIISRGGHPQRAGSGLCEVLTVEVVDGWSKRKINDWFEHMKIVKPWETRQ
jgi:hypothetical protein